MFKLWIFVELERRLQSLRTLCKLQGSKWNKLAALCPWMVASKELDLEVSVGPLG